MQKLKFTKISKEGYSVCNTEKETIFSFGVLPNEYAIGNILVKKKKKFISPEIIENPSPFRIKPRDSSFLSTSFWQIATYEWQCKQKYKMLSDLFPGKQIDEFVQASQRWGYRNKVEYSFMENDGKLTLAFFDRLQKGKLIPVTYFSLVSEKVNLVAKSVLLWLIKFQIPEIALKSLTLRESKTDGRIIALLLFRHREKIPLDCSTIKQIPNLNACIVAYSNPKSPASNIDEVFFKYGRCELDEKIGARNFSYPIDGFFQNNLEMFPKILERMNEKLYGEILSEKASRLNPGIESPNMLSRISDSINLKILELYSGVGAIGQSLSNNKLNITAVDISDTNIDYAHKNARQNYLENYVSIVSHSEKIEESFFQDVDVLILDPSRPGLHPKVIKNIQKYEPHWIIYMSCNPITQSEDISKLLECYRINFLGGYDFYPQTPHLESLVILNKK